jgi:hypothetical protein
MNIYYILFILLLYIYYNHSAIIIKEFVVCGGSAMHYTGCTI